jgi:hypothetical protein
MKRLPVKDVLALCLARFLADRCLVRRGSREPLVDGKQRKSGLEVIDVIPSNKLIRELNMIP